MYRLFIVLFFCSSSMWWLCFVSTLLAQNSFLSNDSLGKIFLFLLLLFLFFLFPLRSRLATIRFSVATKQMVSKEKIYFFPDLIKKKKKKK